jgi:hypothetical protein
MRQSPKQHISGPETKVSIITVNYKTPHHVRNLLKSVEEIDIAIPFEFFLVDNGSGDGSADMVREYFPWVRLIPLPENLGLGAGNNTAIKEANGDYIFICNPDLILESGQIEKWITWMEERPEVGVSGPRLLNPDGTDQDSCYLFPNYVTPILRRTRLGRLPIARSYLNKYLMNEVDRERSVDVDWILGAAMLIRRPVLEEVGLFDENIFLYFEDTDLCRRVWEAGHRVAYTPEAVCRHYHARESKTDRPWEVLTNKLTRIHIKSAVQYFWKHRGKKHPRLS